ncbi:MAG: DUF222 domain-containing protein [Agrococcus casei]|uniref:HNH endonuclease signature motif containing protein n=1 Tax=Agrococcus casei TaxID=343512 RepID=UPI003F8F859F
MSTQTSTIATAILNAASDINQLIERAFDDFEWASIEERREIMHVFSSVALQHQAAVSKFAHAVDKAPTSRRDNAARELDYHSTTELVQHELGVGKTLADGYVRLGRLLQTREYPALTAAVEQGTVSAQQATVIVRLLDEWQSTCSREFILQADASAVRMAKTKDGTTPSKVDALARALTAWRIRKNPEEAELNADEQWENRKATVWRRRDGSVSVNAVLPATVGAAIKQFLDANASPKSRYGSPAEIDERTRPQKMADAFATAFGVAAKSGESCTQGGEAPTLTVTVPIEEMRRYAEGAPSLATVGHTQELIPVAEAAHLVCEGAIQVAAVDKHGAVLELGRSQRLFSRSQRRALNEMYPECALGGCTIPAVWCESHHVTWWSAGGNTDLDNGVNLCNYHHHEVHLGNLHVARDHQQNRWKVTRAIRR